MSFGVGGADYPQALAMKSCVRQAFYYDNQLPKEASRRHPIEHSLDFMSMYDLLDESHKLPVEMRSFSDRTSDTSDKRRV